MRNADNALPLTLAFCLCTSLAACSDDAATQAPQWTTEIAPYQVPCFVQAPGFCILTYSESEGRFSIARTVRGLPFEWGVQRTVLVETEFVPEQSDLLDFQPTRIAVIETLVEEVVAEGRSFEFELETRSWGPIVFFLVELDEGLDSGVIARGSRQKSFVCHDPAPCDALRRAEEDGDDIRLRFSFQSPHTDPLVLEAAEIIPL